MRLAIFGASGRTGQPLVEKAIAAGHQVTALVRNPAKLTVTDPQITVITGDALDPQAVEQTIADADAVISVVGQSKGAPADLQTRITKNIVAAMDRHHVKRLISLTGAGVAAPQDRPKLINHIIKLALKLFSGQVLHDAEQHAAVIQQSDLDWVIVRGPVLTSDPPKGSYRVGWVGVNTASRITRADLAEFLLHAVSDSRYLRQMPMVSN